MKRLMQLWPRIRNVFSNEIWHLEYVGGRSFRARFYAALRMVSITVRGVFESNVFSRAAALSFSTMLGLGPLVAIIMMVAGFMLKDRDPEVMAQSLSEMIEQAVPQVAQLRQAEVEDGSASGNLGLEQMISGFIAGSRNGAVGVAGVVSLIIIVIQLFTSVETSFNEIWGVKRGRSWLLRIVFYWTVLTLGAVLFFASLTGLSAASVMGIVQSSLELEDSSMLIVRRLLQAGSVAVLVGMLTVFYRTVPNTHVWWRAAVVGAFVVTVLLIVNNALAFLYLKRVLLQKTLYGSLGLVPVLMFGLYIFWLFVLIGGLVSYAVQNANFRNSQAAWGRLSGAIKERLSLAVFLTIGRRFQSCEQPYKATELGGILKVPTQLLNACLGRLVGMNLVAPIPPTVDEDSMDYRYQPARPLTALTLGDFRRTEAEFGDDGDCVAFQEIDPLIARYKEAVERRDGDEFFGKPLDELIRECGKEGNENGRS